MHNILSCSTSSYSKFPLERALQGIAGSGLKYVELAAIPGPSAHVCPEKMSPVDRNELKQMLRNYGLTVSSMSGHCDIPTPDGFAHLKACIDFAEEFGFQVINTAEGNIRTPDDEARFFVNIRKLADYAAQRNVRLCLETHGGKFGTGPACRKTLEEIGKDNVLINYDPGNLIYYADARPETDIVTIADKVGHFHIKDKLEGAGVRNFPEIGTGTIDFKVIFDALKAVNYNGVFSFELEFTPGGKPAPETDQALIASAAYVRALLE